MPCQLSLSLSPTTVLEAGCSIYPSAIAFSLPVSFLSPTHPHLHFRIFWASNGIYRWMGYGIYFFSIYFWIFDLKWSKMIKFVFKQPNSYSNDQIWIQMDQSRVDSALPPSSATVQAVPPGPGGPPYRPVPLPHLPGRALPPTTRTSLSLVMFATFILVLFYRYDRVTSSLWIRYPGILLGEGYNWHLYACRLFCG
jgi:hypothetical protein